MTTNFDRAFRLWKRYKTQTKEYQDLAEAMNCTTTDLNVKCSERNGREVMKGKSHGKSNS